MKFCFNQLSGFEGHGLKSINLSDLDQDRELL